MQYFSPENAISWVDENAKQISGHSRKYLPFAPYDQEDFLQDAYEAALEAVEVSIERQIPFSACFWVLFKGKVSDVTPNPGSKRNAGSCSPPRTNCEFSDFAIEKLDPSDIFDPVESLSTIDVDQVYPFIREHLTSVENLTLEAVIGIYEGPMKIKEAARYLKCSPSNIRQTLSRAYSRISDLVANGELNIQIVDGEIVQLPPKITNTTLAPLEVGVEAQVSKAIKETSFKRRDDTSEKNPDQDEPRLHQSSMDSRKPNPYQPTGPKALQLACWSDYHWLSDMKGFVAANDNVTERSIVSLIQRESKECLANNLSGIEEASGTNSIVSQISSPNCRDGINFHFPETCADRPSTLRNQPTPTSSNQYRIQTEPACRNGPVPCNSDRLPDGDSFEIALLRSAA